jgi:hypothetical protein
MEPFEVGDLVRDKLNEGDGSYGLGVVVTVDSEGLCAEEHPNGIIDNRTGWSPGAAQRYGELATGVRPNEGKRYDVYFNKFERTITFHGDYLEKV